MDFTDKSWSNAHVPPDPARACPSVTTVKDLAGADTELVFVVHHGTTMEVESAGRKSRNAVM